MSLLRVSLAAALAASALGAWTMDATAAGNRRSVKSIAITLSEDGGAYYEQIVRGARQGARSLGSEVAFNAVSCRNDAATQMRQIDEFVRAGVDVILIQRSYSGDSSPAVQRARQAGVTVVAIDVDVPGGTDAVVKPDEGRGGALAARYIAKRLNGHGKVAIADGPSRSRPLRERVAAFREVLTEYSDITIVEDEDTGMSREGARSVMSGYLLRHPDLDAVWAVNDPVALYCELEAQAASRRNLFIVGTEGSPVSVKAMKDPTRLIEASPGADPFALAQRAVELGAAVRRGERAPGAVELMPFVELTRANVDGYRGWTR